MDKEYQLEHKQMVRFSKLLLLIYRTMARWEETKFTKFSAYHSIQDYSTDVVDNRLDIIGLNLGLGKRLRWPMTTFL